MKKIIFAFLILFSISGFSQEDANTDSSADTKNVSAKKYNVSTEPILLLVGYANLAADFKLTDSWTLGPVFSYWSTKISSGDSYYVDTIKLTSYEFGVRANWYKNGVFQDGLYLSPVLEFVSAKADTISNAEPLSSSLSELTISGLVGYQWFWNNFNLRLGGGLTVNTVRSKIHLQSNNSTYTQDVSYDPTSFGITTDFLVGFAF